MPRVFISSTSTDLATYRRVARDVIDRNQWDVEWMERFPGEPSPTVDECQQKVRECDLLLLIVAFRYGSEPPGGDRSYTMYELQSASEFGIPVRVLMARDTWPGNLWEDSAEARQRITQFRGDVSRIAEFFDHEEPLADLNSQLPRFAALVERVLLNHRDWIHRCHERLDVAALRHLSHEGFSIGRALAELRAIANGRVFCPMAAIRDAYRAAHPRAEHLLHVTDAPTALVSAAASLAALPAMAGTPHPLLTFLCTVAETAPGERRRLLMGGLANACPGLPHEPQPVQRAAPPRFPSDVQSPPARQTLCRIVVRFDPSLLDSGGHLVSAWVCSESRPRRLPLDPAPWTSANRRDRLAELHREILREGPPEGRTVLEFVVPRSLLGEEFDQWRISDGELGYIGRLVDHFPIVVRSLDRLRLPLAKVPSENRWKTICRTLDEPCGVYELPHTGRLPHQRAVWVSDPKSGEQLHRLLQGDDPVACALLTRAPGTQFSQRKIDVFKALLLLGVPIMLWPRRSVPPTNLREELFGLIQDQCLRDLPRRVHAHRRRDEEVVRTSKMLTLVWDDPDQSVPDPDRDPLISPLAS